MKCPICKEKIRKGDGMHYNSRTIHKNCLGIAKAFWYTMVKK